MAAIVELTPQEVHTFQTDLQAWAAAHPRPLPWKGETDPYLIWLSEIILQQTRVEQGRAYFEKFKHHYPTVNDLAKAPSDEVMKHWQGLGYYSRARNMHAAAQYISNELKGQFPSDYKSILALKGVGSYTAAAIASFAYGLPHAVIDGNVYRVLSRIWGIDIPIDSTIGKKGFAALAQALLPPPQAAAHNQAIMDFGATQCKPKSPNCEDCNFVERCVAYHDNTIGTLPVKAKKIKRTKRYFHYLVISDGESSWIEKRSEKDIWKDLYQFPLIELPTDITTPKVAKEHIPTFLDKHQLEYRSCIFLGKEKQDLTHQQINAYFWKVNLMQPLPEHDVYIAMNPKNLHNFAFPKTITSFLSKFDYL